MALITFISLLPIFAPAATYYWDSDDATTGGSSGTTASGTWGIDPFWNTDSTGTSATANTAITTSDTVVFCAGTDVAGASTVTLDVGGKSAGNLTFEEGTVTITASTLTLGAASTIDVSAVAAPTISSTVAGAATSLDKSGTGTLILSGANTYAGLTTISAGTLAYGAHNVIADTGDVAVDGATAILSLASFTDTVRIVTVDNGGQITGNGTLTSSGGNFQMKDGTVSAILAGSGIRLYKTTAGTVTLSGANSYTGLTSITVGTLAYGASDVIGTGDVTVDAFGLTAILDLGNNHTDSVGTVMVRRGGQIIGTETSALTSTGTFEMQDGSVSAILAGSGIALNKTTAGAVTLSGANSYTGNTTVSEGTLNVTGSLANNGSDKVFMAASAILTRSVASGYGYHANGAYGSQFTTGLGTKADIVQGLASTASTVTMQWTAHTAGDGLASDVVDISGMPGHPVATDPFTLEMSYDPSLVTGSPVVGWYDTAASTWVNAVNGNIGSGSSVLTGQLMSWGYFVSTYSITDANLQSFLGSWGVDTTTHVAWAVLNHNSEFAVIPEPSALALLALGGMALLRRRRCRSSQ